MRYVAADPYCKRCYFFSTSSHLDFVRYGTSNEIRLNDFRSCKRDVAIAHNNETIRTNHLLDCMVALGYEPQGNAKSSYEDHKKYFG